MIYGFFEELDDEENYVMESATSDDDQKGTDIFFSILR